MINRRVFMKDASWVAAGLVLGSHAQIASAESAKELVIHNNYNATVAIDLFHPQSINTVFATWTFASSEQARLVYKQEPLRVKSDWGIRVRFGNGALSAVMRLFEVGYGLGPVKASAIYDNPFATYFQDVRKIKKIDGYSIDPRFGATETNILKNALAIFYERFLQNHSVGCPELCTRSAYHWNLNRSHFEDAEDERDYIEIQRARFSANNVFGFAFPRVELEYANVDDNWLARAYVGTVSIRPREKDDDNGPYPVTGSFKMEVNDHFVNNTQKFRHYGHPAYWAGVIAHEALHNLGHLHPPSRSDQQYYLHQMIIVEHLVMKGDKIRYGDANPTPVLCQKRP